MIYTETTTVDDALACWDKGESIWSVEMGGLGPGYEQAIQVLIVELLRDQKEKPLPADGDRDAWWKWGDETVSRLDTSCGGFSGAQVGVAKHVAARMLRMGYGAALVDAKQQIPDRIIQISRAFPRAPEVRA